MNAADFFYVIARAKQAGLPRLYDPLHLHDHILNHCPAAVSFVKMLQKMLTHAGWEDAVLPHWAAFKDHFKRRQDVMQQAFELLISLADDNDGYCDPLHDEWLREGAQFLGYKYLRPKIHSDADSYALLGVKPHDTVAAIQAAYHLHIAQHHPDRWAHHGNKFTAARAQAKTAQLNRAYADILQRIKK